MTIGQLRWLFFLIPAFANAQDRSQARSMVIPTRGIVATAQTLAAIAANAVLSVVEPMMNAIPEPDPYFK